MSATIDDVIEDLRLLGETLHSIADQLDEDPGRLPAAAVAIHDTIIPLLAATGAVAATLSNVPPNRENRHGICLHHQALRA